MLFGNGLCVFGRHMGIERAFGIDYHYGAEGTQTETTRLYDEHVVNAELRKTLFKLRYYF